MDDDRNDSVAENDMSAPQPKDIPIPENSSDELSTIIKILQKPSNDRRELDIKLLMNYTKDLEFFQKLNKKSQYANKTHKQCCKAMSSSTFPGGRPIISYGDIPKCFYIILSGSCLILIPKSSDFTSTHTSTLTELQRIAAQSSPDQDTQNISHKRIQLLQWKMSIEFSETMETFHSIENGKIVYKTEFLQAKLGGLEKSKSNNWGKFFDIDTGVLNFFCVSELGGGKVFGEMGLIQGSARKATVVAKGEVVVAVIGKVDYTKI
jgi:CRP-like cAMP-binding protein